MVTPGSPPVSYPPPPQSIPGVVIAACVIWILYGVLGVLVGLVTVATAAKQGSIFSIVIGAAFVATAIQVFMGKASQILASGIVCIVLGSIFLMFALTGVGFLPGIMAVLVMVQSALLMVSGILACVGNRDYKRWRAGKFRLPFPG